MKYMLLGSLAFLAIGCSSPLAPSGSAQIEQRGELRLECDVKICTFVGTAINIGNARGSGVSGITSFSVAGRTVVAIRVEVNPEIPAGGQSVFSGVIPKSVLLDMRGHWTSDTLFTWQR